MPAAYLEPLVSLAVFGTGATPSQKQAQALVATFAQASLGTIALTGVLSALAVLAPGIVFTSAEKIILTGQVSADVTSSGLEGMLQIDITQDGVPIIAPIQQSYTGTATGVSVTWTVRLPPGVGTHSWAIRAKATGDGSLSVAASHAALIMQVVTV